jgi:hypothetical protein
MAILKNTSISGTNNLTLSPNSTSNRPSIITSIIRWTNTSSQSYSVLAGPTPTLTNTSWTAPTGVTQVEVLVVGGGGGGGYNGGGGGGAGGLLYSAAYTVTPGTSYTVTVGTGGVGGSGSTVLGSAGTNSVFDTLTAFGGGGGNSRSTTSGTTAGGSGGGGASASNGFASSAGTGTSGQGTNGGVGTASDLGANAAGGGGGGAGNGGQAGTYVLAGGGGNGLNFSITGTPTWYAGGGGGGTCVNGLNPAQGGLGGGGGGGIATSQAGVAGTASTGGGGGGGNGSGTPGTGGSGVVIIRYAVTSTDLTPLGIMQYNSDLKAIEVYEGPAAGWVSQDPLRNFAGHNLFTFSSTFTNASWLANNATTASSATISPDGGGNVFTAIPSVGNTTHQLYHQTGVTVTAVPYTFSIHVKANGYTQVRLADVSNGNGVWFNVSAGTVGSATAGFTGRIIVLGNDWYRCTITFTPTAGSQNYGIYIGNTTETTSFAGNGTSGLFVWGAQFEQATTPSPYVATNGAASPVPTSLDGYRYHTYTTTGTSGFTPAVTGNVEVLVVGGGGAGGRNGTVDGAGGGGAGGVLYCQNYPVTSGQQYTVVVGAGGLGVASPNTLSNDGNPSQFGTLWAMGGGRGGGETNPRTGYPGGSGGGAGGYASKPGGPGIPGQGNAGGACIGPGDGGGGGAGGAGGNGYYGYGGHGRFFPQFASVGGFPAGWFGGGGGASGDVRNGVRGSAAGRGGIGGGGSGAPATTGGTAQSGGANTGGGGGGAAGSGNPTYPSVGSVIAPGSGGSGIVIVRYRYD